MDIMCMQALRAIQDARVGLSQLADTEEYKLLNAPTGNRYSGGYHDERRRRLYALIPDQVKAIVNRIGIDKLYPIEGLGPKRIQSLLEYAAIEEFIPPTYWLIYYTYFDADVKIDINTVIQQSPASWLVEYLENYPDHLVTLKMALSITEEEYNLF